jgi:DNA-binding transcriptional regulator LsrR (DeoR family)
MIKMLMDGCTCYTISDETGLHIVTVQSYLRAMHKEGVVHIMGWVKNSRGVDSTHIYKLGIGQDKPRAKMTRAEIAKRYRFKKRLRVRMQLERAIMQGTQA